MIITRGVVESRIESCIKKSLKSIIVAFVAIMLFACNNDMETISSFEISDTLPGETATDIEVIYSDSGKIMIKLISSKLIRYQNENPYLEFPEGLKLLFYDSAMVAKTELTANYGINWENQKRMEVKDNVVIIDHEKNETLNTEHIVWDQRKKKIFSDVFVKRTTPDGVIYGDGFDSDESLKNYVLRRPRGVFTIQDEELN